MAVPDGYMTSDAIEGVLALLHAAYPNFTQLIQLPEITADQQRVIQVLRIGAGTGDLNGVLLVGGTHARELVNPDALVGLAYRLCWSYEHNLDVTLGQKVWRAADIRLLVEGLDIFILPLLNPDGREYVRLYDPWWRKNRGYNSDGSRGTDLNRNYDFLWKWAIGQTSTNPSNETYYGSAPFSEPETRNVRWLLDTYPNINGFVDVHSYSELILFPWGDDQNQTTDPSQNFLNPAWNGMRGTTGGYGEYIPADDLGRFTDMASRVHDAIAAVRGRSYTAEQGFQLYGTSGASSDYAYSRFFIPGGHTKVWALDFESNRGDRGSQYGFQPFPYDPDALEVSKEVQSGLIQFMTSCVCVVREIGRSLATTSEILNGLSNFRDAEMMKSDRGRKWVDLLDRHGTEALLLLRKDRAAWAAAGKIFTAAAAIVHRRESASPPKIDRSLVTQMERLAARLEKRASPQLKHALADVRRDLRKVVGKTARQVLN
jgi:murein tripeptide amidase MpaA